MAIIQKWPLLRVCFVCTQTVHLGSGFILFLQWLVIKRVPLYYFFHSYMQDVSLPAKLAELFSVLCGLLYYPTEHMAWLVDNKLVTGKSTSLWTIAMVLWGLPLLISALQSTTALMSINQEMELLWRQEKSSNSMEKQVTFSDQRQYVGRTPQMQVLMGRRFHILLSIIQSLSDFVNAVHWLPEGVLWSGKLPLFWVGLLGTLSSLIGLYKIVPGHVV